MCQTMNREWIAAAGQDGSSHEPAERGHPKTAIVQRYSCIVLADQCARSAPGTGTGTGTGTNLYQQDAA
ncbi:MAG: hypothetical protein QOE48_4424 [Mycobacterium sp.]|jgi:hypothetical protein|nr:hypothetical protein [Mycobacterium sp.]